MDAIDARDEQRESVSTGAHALVGTGGSHAAGRRTSCSNGEVVRAGRRGLGGAGTAPDLTGRTTSAPAPSDDLRGGPLVVVDWRCRVVGWRSELSAARRRCAAASRSSTAGTGRPSTTTYRRRGPDDGDRLHRGDQPLHVLGGGAEADRGPQRLPGAVVDRAAGGTQQVPDQRVGAERAVPDADAVFGRQGRGDHRRLLAGDGEGDHADAVHRAAEQRMHGDARDVGSIRCAGSRSARVRRGPAPPGRRWPARGRRWPARRRRGRSANRPRAGPAAACSWSPHR